MALDRILNDSQPVLDFTPALRACLSEPESDEMADFREELAWRAATAGIDSDGSWLP